MIQELAINNLMDYKLCLYKSSGLDVQDFQQEEKKITAPPIALAVNQIYAFRYKTNKDR